MDKAKQLAEQAQQKLDEAQKNFNKSDSPESQPQGDAVKYDEHGRPIQEATPAGATAPPAAEPAAPAPPAPDPTAPLEGAPGGDAPSAPAPDAPAAPAADAPAEPAPEEAPPAPKPADDANTAPDPFKPIQ
jgi:hypothetical protein